MNKNNFLNVNQLTLRGLIIGTLGSILIAASSMYVALRLSSLPWPTVFVAILSLTLLRLLSKTDMNEVNITQTTMSAGSMVAGGLAFTVPGLWIYSGTSNAEFIPPSMLTVMLISIAGVLVGAAFCFFLRRKFIEVDKLPFPIGMAAADVITISADDKSRSVALFGAMGISGVFVWLRDKLFLIPQMLPFGNTGLGLVLMPMGAGIGYIVGFLNTGVWFLGALLAAFVTPLFMPADAAAAFNATAGIGIMIGVGLGVFIKFIYSQISTRKQKDTSQNDTEQKIKTPLVIIACAIAYVLTVISGLGIFASILVIAGAAVATSMSGASTGQTGINPMEIFAIIVLLAIRVVTKQDIVSSFLIAGVVAVACGYAGDLMNDYKVGHIIGTNNTAIMIGQLIGGLAGVFIAVPVMFLLIESYGGIGSGTLLPAAQAEMVARMINGIGEPIIFYSALGIGLLLCLLNLPVLTLGLGIYLPFGLTATIFVGGIVRLIVEKVTKKDTNDMGQVIASGLLGGESIVGVIIALIAMFSRG